MGLGDEKTWKIDKPIGIQSEQDRKAISIARQRDQFLGKVSREARRNKDLRAYLEAERAGYTIRGIENVDDKNARFRESANQRRFYGDSAVGPGQPPTGGSQPPNVGTPSTTGTPPVPAPTAGSPVGSGSKIGTGEPLAPSAPAAPSALKGTQPPTGTAQPATPAMSAAEQSKQATLEKTLAGNFGKVAQARAEAKQSGGTYDATPSFDTRTEGRKAFVDVVGTLNGKEGGITPKEVEQAQARGAALGLIPQQIQDTLDGETDLSPEAIAGRAKGRKDAAYQKAIAGLDKTKFTPEQIAQIKENMKGLSGQDKKDSTEKAATSRAEREETRIREKEGTGAPDTYNPLGEALDKLETMSDSSVDFANASTERTRKLLESVDLNRKTWEARTGMATSEYEAAKNKLPDKPQRPRPDKPEARPDHVYGQSLSGDFKQVAGGTLEGAHAILSGAGDVLGGVASWADDRVTDAGNYIVNPEMRVPTRAEIRDFAESKGVSYEKGREIFETERAKRNLKKKGMMPEESSQASIDTNNASKEFRSGYDSLKALESFTI